MNNTNNNKGTKKFNPTITAMFENNKFGEGALLSAAIDAKGFSEIQKHLSIGSKLVLRRSAKKASSGNTTYFLEILPPLADQGNRRANSSSNDDGI